VARSRTVIIAGAGIGGLSCALALIRRGFRAVVLEQADRLEEAGAGIQLSPNATRILIDLGLAARLIPVVVAPEAIRILRGRNGREIARTILGAAVAFRYGAPYWVVHRGDLQAALVESLQAAPDGALRLGCRVEDFAVHPRGVTVQVRSSGGIGDEHGIALVGADGLWSSLRARLGDRTPVQFCGRTAWRAIIPANRTLPDPLGPATYLWLGPEGHLVHYPVKSGQAINIVAIVRDDWRDPGWHARGARTEILERFSGWAWGARALLAVPDVWFKWALFERPVLHRWSSGPVTLLGDAAHPMLPFLAQGGAMAIEDAAVLADCLGRGPDEPALAFATYEGLRRSRTQRVQRASRGNGRIYHLRGLAARARDLALHRIGGERLLTRYDWLYDWRHA